MSVNLSPSRSKSSGKSPRRNRRGSALPPVMSKEQIPETKPRSATIVIPQDIFDEDQEEDEVIARRTNLTVISKQTKRLSILTNDLFTSSSEGSTDSSSSTSSKRLLRKHRYKDIRQLQKLSPRLSKYIMSREVLVCIMGQMHYKDIIHFSTVCKFWNDASKDRAVWTQQFQIYEKKLLNNQTKKDVDLWDYIGHNPSYEASKKEKWTTLNDLVLRLTPYKTIPEQFEVEALLMTYTSFTTTEQLILKLYQRYNVPIPQSMSDLEFDLWNREVKMPIQARTCFILKSLIKLKYSDMSLNLKRLLNIIVRLLDGSFSTIIKSQIIKEIELLKKETIPEITISKPSSRRGSLLIPKIMLNSRKNNKIFVYNSLDISKELTLIEFSVFKKIQASELQGQSWSKDGKLSSSPNIWKMIEHFNFLSRVISSSILCEEKAKTRSKIFTKWVKISFNLAKLQNYHTLMAILMGLGESSVYRLKSTKELIKPKYIEILEHLNSLMSPDQSYSMYRKKLAESNPPCIPYIGIYLRDLTYIESTPGKREIDGLEGIRFKQNLQVFNVINMIKSYQKVKYEFDSIPELNVMIHEMPSMTEEECYSTSYRLEPKKH